MLLLNSGNLLAMGLNKLTIQHEKDEKKEENSVSSTEHKANSLRLMDILSNIGRH